MDNLDPKMKTADAVAGLSANKRKLFALMLERKRADKRERQDIPPRPKDRPIPLSFAQRGLWLLDRLGESSAYHLLLPIQFSGRIATRALDRAMNEIVRRHEILRTVFGEKDGEPYQEIHPHRLHRLPRIDLSCLGETERARGLEQCALGLARLAFDLELGPMWRAMVVTISGDKHAFLLSMHHIVSDGWSNEVLLRELSGLYDSFCRNRRSSLAELKAQYADFSVWQHDILAGKDFGGHLTYWQRQLAGAPAFIDLIPDRPRPARLTQAGALFPFTLEGAPFQGLKALARQERGTPFMVLLAAYAAMLRTYSGQTDILVGSPVANRNLAWTEPMIGFLVNTLVLRCDLSGNPTFSQLIGRVRQTTLDAYRHQDLPFELLVERLRPPRDPSRSPLFQVVMVFQNAGPSEGLLSDQGLQWLVMSPPQAQFELSLAFTETKDRLYGSIEYNSDLFHASTVARMAGHFLRLTEALVADPNLSLCRLSPLSDRERHQVLIAWNDTGRLTPRKAPIHYLLESGLAGYGDACALALAGDADGPGRRSRYLSYRALDRCAGILARTLVLRGVGPDVPVGLCAEPSPEMAAAFFAVLKAGGAVLPLDPEYPQARLGFMLEDSAAALLLTEPRRATRFRDGRFEVLALDGLEKEPETANHTLLPRVDPDHTACLIYTSGSTGTPKGVRLTHGPLSGYTEAMAGILGLGTGDRVLQLASIGFDVLLEELLPVISRGGALVLRRDRLFLDGAALQAFCERFAVTGLELSAGHWHQWVDVLTRNRAVPPRSLRFVIVGCDRMSPDRLSRWRRFGIPLFHVFGLTETTVTSLVQRSGPDPGPGLDPASLAVGRPIAGTRAYLVDGSGRPVPIGVPGELFLGGSGSARCYHGRAALTAARFLPDPFSAEPGARLYRTGDLARAFPDGRIEFLGRCDQQINLRGFRIEPGEIQAVLGRHPAVGESAVLLREDRPGDRKLVAYLVPRAGLTEADEIRWRLRELLAERLPTHMVPSVLVWIDALPLTPNGKLDRAALPAPDAGASPESENFAAPRSQTEAVLADIWKEVLDRDRVGIHDNFFELGGHSLMATQVVSRIRDRFSREVPVRALFDAPTVAGLAHRLARAPARKGAGIPVPVPVPRTEPLPLSFAQQRLWFLDQLEGERIHHYNVPCALRLKGRLSVFALERSVTEIVGRHEVLRTLFRELDGLPHQQVRAAMPTVLPVLDLAGLSPRREAVLTRDLAREEAARPFDLKRDLPLRISLVRQTNREWVLLCTMHHLVCDDWSLKTWIAELGTLYEAFLAERPSPLSPLPLQYADYAYWQRRVLPQNVLDSQLRYWKDRLAGAPPLLELPTDYPRPAVRTYRGDLFQFGLSRALSERLALLARNHEATMFMLLQAVFAVLLGRYSGQEEVVIGTGIANRPVAALEGLIGLFLNIIALRCNLADNPSFPSLLRAVRSDTLAAHEHQDLPFESLVDAMNLDRDTSYSPIFQVMLVMDTVPEDGLGLRGLALTPLEGQHSVAKYDLTLFAQERREGLTAAFEYNTDLFAKPTVAAMADRLCRLLEEIADDANRAIGDIPMVNLPAGEALAAAFAEDLEAV